MDSPTKPQAGDGDAADSPPLPSIEAYEGVGVMPAPATQKPRSKTKTPELSIEQQGAEDGAPPTPSPLETFDWVDFEARYESALRDADQSEREILKEAEDLSKVRTMHQSPYLSNVSSVLSSLGFGGVGA